MKCGLCGYEFTEEEAACSRACPLAGGCAVVCCPRCGYGAPDESRSTVLRLARRARDIVRRRPRPREADVDA